MPCQYAYFMLDENCDCLSTDKRASSFCVLPMNEKRSCLVSYTDDRHARVHFSTPNYRYKLCIAHRLFTLFLFVSQNNKYLFVYLNSDLLNYYNVTIPKRADKFYIRQPWPLLLTKTVILVNTKMKNLVFQLRLQTRSQKVLFSSSYLFSSFATKLHT